MAKSEHQMTKPGTGAGAATARAVEPAAEPARPDSTPSHEEIARLAQIYWQARGCPEGSPEEDWLRAEAELRRQAATIKD